MFKENMAIISLAQNDADRLFELTELLNKEMW